jgi:hypothetical protein
MSGNEKLVGRVIQIVRQDTVDGHSDGPLTLYFQDGTSARIVGAALYGGDAALGVEFREDWS